MAEYVQQTLEEMTNEVQQLERVGLFDQSEIKKMINKRKRYEYKLRRRVKTKEDYLTYIEYEGNVLDLINVRRKQDGYKHKKGEIEGAILKRIMSLYQFACRNWPQSQELWLNRIIFIQTKMKNRSLVSSMYNRMLRVITNKPNLWLMAAKYEFEAIYSMESARHVLQKAVSFNQQCKVLWLEFFRLELLFIDFVRRREKLKEAKLLGKVSIPKYAEDDTLSDKVKNGQIAIRVCSYAREKIPDDVEFTIEFLSIAKQFTWTKDVVEHVFSVLFEDFPEHPEVWQLEAGRFIDTLDTQSSDFCTQFDEVQRKCNKLLKKMIKKVESEKSWSVYLAVNERLLKLNRTEDVQSRFALLLALVHKKGFLSEEWMMKWMELVASKEGVSEVLDLFKMAVKSFPQSQSIWQAYIEYASLAVDIHRAVNVFHRARKCLTKESLPLWQLITRLSTGALDNKELMDLYETAVVCDSSVAGAMKEEYIHWVYHTQGIRKVRPLYTRLRQTISVTQNFHKMYIAMEKCEVTPDVERMRKAYRHMVHDFGSSSIDAWLEIMELEKSVGDVGKTSVLYSQAIKSLNDDLVQEFMHQHTLRSRKASV